MLASRKLVNWGKLKQVVKLSSDTVFYDPLPTSTVGSALQRFLDTFLVWWLFFNELKTGNREEFYAISATTLRFRSQRVSESQKL